MCILQENCSIVDETMLLLVTIHTCSVYGYQQLSDNYLSVIKEDHRHVLKPVYSVYMSADKYMVSVLYIPTE